MTKRACLPLKNNKKWSKPNLINIIQFLRLHIDVQDVYNPCVDRNTSTIQLSWGREKEIVFSVISDDPPPLMVLSLIGEHLKLCMGAESMGLHYQLHFKSSPILYMHDIPYRHLYCIGVREKWLFCLISKHYALKLKRTLLPRGGHSHSTLNQWPKDKCIFWLFIKGFGCTNTAWSWLRFCWSHRKFPYWGPLNSFDMEQVLCPHFQIYHQGPAVQKLYCSQGSKLWTNTAQDYSRFS